MRRSPLYRRSPQSVGMRMPRSPARAAQPHEPTIARIAADALDNYMARADAVPAWVFATDDGGAPPPNQPDCDALYGALGLSGAITATLSAAERQSLWSRATFLRRVGEILGRFEFVDAAGRPVSGPGDPDVRAARFVPADADTVAAALIARWPDVFDDVADALAWARRLWRCAASPATRQPGENFRAALVAAEAQASGERSALNRYAADIGRVRLVTAANEPLFLQQPPSPRVAAGPDAPPLQYYLQEINGDGACFYRSIASALVQRLTGINLGRGATFSRDVQSGVSDAWATEDYGGLVRAGGPPNDVLALLLNGVAKWVKFYVYLVMCSDDIPPDAVTYVGGVTGIGRIEPMTSIDEMVAPGAARRIMGEAAGDVGDGDDGDVAVVIYRPPTLDLVVRYVVWLYEALANTMVGGRQTLSWAEVRPYALPLLAVPWDAAGPQRTLPADKTILFHDCQEADTVDVDLALLLQDSSAEYVAALAAGGDVDAAYRTYCNVMRQSVRWGGAAEAYAFASILLPDADSPALGSVRGVVIFNYADPAQATALVPQAVPSRPAIDRATGMPVRRDYRADCLAVLYVGSHYVALHGVRQSPDGTIAPYVEPLSPDALDAFVTVDGTQPAPPPHIEARAVAPTRSPARGLAVPSPLVLPPTSPSLRAVRPYSPLARRGVATPPSRPALPWTGGPPRRGPAPQGAAAQSALRRRQVQEAAASLAALADATGLPADLLRDSVELREQLRAVGEASEIPRDVTDAVWAAFARGAG
ncbi:atrophin-1 superfamily incomplete domain containing protein [Pandoravirus japonicus]|uniref:Atrophin-1 superfamily incomplete domain containing protein n=1 Tax=Pandoravirus japonicus TaxID=2823154 RepID=A0A811BRE6_9VIRU|nr:atrophin-1 superfamily incomplete domain containing protein [Pandoravirus japonicus]